MGFSTIPHNIFSANRTHVCYADRYKYDHMNYDGLVYKCTARDYSEDRAVGKLVNGGKIEYKPGIMENIYQKANFENRVCCQCKKLPICGGPCLQKTLEAGKNNNNCVNKHKEMDVKTFIEKYYLGVRSQNNTEFKTR
jgi:uncharacterized protein